MRYAFGSPPGVTSTAPYADGVYPLTKAVVAPQMAKYVDKGYGEAAFSDAGNSPCDIVLTVDAKGDASDAVITRCDHATVEKPAMQSLLSSHYKAGSLNGKAIPVRVTIHLEYAGFTDKK